MIKGAREYVKQERQDLESGLSVVLYMRED